MPVRRYPRKNTASHNDDKEEKFLAGFVYRQRTAGSASVRSYLAPRNTIHG